MPLTPFHLGPALFFGFLLLHYLDLPTFLIANVMVDLEPLLVLTFNLDYPLHGFFHSFLGGTLAGLSLTIFMTRIRESFSPLLSFFKLETKSSLMGILRASLFGVSIHILLDSCMHSDIKPFYPLDLNPFLQGRILAGLNVYVVCMWCFIGATLVYGLRLVRFWRKNRIEVG